jgi:HEAT repeat protein
MNRIAALVVALAILLGSQLPAWCVDESDVPRLIEKLKKDEQARNRRAAARDLALLGPRAKKAVSALIEALKDTESSVRDESENALRKIGEPAVDELVAALKQDKDEFVRLRLVNIIGAIGPDARSALPALEAAQKDESSFVREGAEEAIFRVKFDTKTALSYIHDKDEETRLRAVRLVGKFTTEQAKGTLQELCKLLRNDKSKMVRLEAAATLAKHGKDKELGTTDKTAIISALTAALKDQDDAVRISAATGLGDIGPAARSALPALTQAFKATKNEDLKEALTKADALIQGKKPPMK